ncbi:MAG: cadmium-translocating P-type ATPase [Clostridia bacterium]|nr:cadmium-translocating P-type ATPase [Clostridia bacterium]
MKGKKHNHANGECSCGHCHEETHHEDVLSCGCGHCHDKDTKINDSTNKSVISFYKFDFIKIILSTLIIILAMVIGKEKLIGKILYLCAYAVAGYELIISCIKSIFKGNAFDESTLMIVASVTALVMGEYFEGAFIVVLFNLGETLEGVATVSSRKKIVSLADFTNVCAHYIDKTGMKDILPEEVPVGSLIEVKKGERIPIDGVLIGACIELDMKAITGESKYYTVNNGETVYSGAINVGDPFVMRTTKLYKDSTVEQIFSMVEGAATKKAKSQKFISAFAKVYTPIIVALALLIAVVPPLFDSMNFVKWIYKGLSFLVISCPCALVISVPLAFFIAIGSLAKKGVLVKGSSYLETLTNVKIAIFDKTGTLTKGNFAVTMVKTQENFDEKKLAQYIYSLEKFSNHPVSKAITEYYDGVGKLDAINVKEIAGQGLVGVINGETVLVGNVKLLKNYGIYVDDDIYVGTVVFVAVNGQLAQTIYITDQIKEGSAQCVEKLKKLGVNQTIMLSGDKKEIAEKIGCELGLDKVYSELMPADKLNVFNKIMGNGCGKTLYVGDGINDSPTLRIADVGVAMGGLGSEIAVESSDVVIMDDDIKKLPMTIKFAKKIKKTVMINIIGSLVIKFAIMFLSIILPVPIWVAMLADVGVMLLAVLNSLLSGKIK